MLPRLLNHLIWADERTARSLASLPAASPELLKVYAHILGAEATWLARINGGPPVTPWPDLDLAGCGGLAAQNHSAIRAMVSRLNPLELARPVSYSNSTGDAFTSTVEEMLHQVVLHGMYHRGQVARGVRLAGGTPLPTDFIRYVREVEAARDST